MSQSKDASKDTNKESKKTSSLAIVDLLRYTYRFAEGKRGWMFLCFFMFVIVAVIDQMDIVLIGYIFNRIQLYGIAEIGFYKIAAMLGSLFLLDTFSWSLHGPARIIEQKVAFYASKKFREYLYENTLNLSLTFHNAEHSGQIISKINKGVISLESYIESFFLTIRSVVTSIAVFVTLYIFNLYYAIAGLALLLITYYVVSIFENKTNPHRDNVNKIDNVLSEIIYDTISNITTIKMLSLSSIVSKSIDKEVHKKYISYVKKNILEEWKWYVPSFIGTIFIVAVLINYVHMSFVSGTAIMTGSLYTLYGFLSKLKAVLYDSAWLMNNTQQKHRDIINSEYLSDHFSEIKKVQYKQIEKIDSLEIRDLDFKYSEAFDLHIDELKFEKGKSYALVGESGCGKTTTMKILASLIETEGYSLLVNGGPTLDSGPSPEVTGLPPTPSPRGGENANALVLAPSLEGMDGGRPALDGFGVGPMHLENIREAVMLIPQEPELFSNTIRENITLGLPFTEDEVNEVLDMVNMKETVDGLPEGRESKVFEKGVNLSGGQKQRLALARGILFAKSKEMILLDEPTSSVDQDNEERIYESLIKIAHDKILISSVHKKNLLKYFDYVIHFEKGRVSDIIKQ